MDDDALLAGLTPRQREAVAHEDGPLLVLAGAGSGKTRVVTRRAARLSMRVGPPRVLAITFTNKASEEMRQRVEALGVGRGMWVCTFHSLCARLLRLHGERVGLPPNFTIVDQADRAALVKQAIEDCGLSSERWRPRVVEQQISQAKNDMISAEQFAADAGDFVSRTIARVYRQYEALMAEQKGADFDDLLVRTAELLRDHEEVRARLEDRFVYLLIDEYQDTNHAQYLIARSLARGRRNICATGDPDQSIYGWRGADLSNILDFERDYPDVRVVRLEQNFRSTGRILSAASALIENNRRRKAKTLWTENDRGAAVHVWTCADQQDEARRIAEDVASHCADGGAAGDVAVFYRVTALTRVLEDALRRARIPYQIARGVEFYNRKEIKDVLAYVRIVVNPADATAAARAAGVPTRGIGKTTLERVVEFARREKIDVREALARAEQIEEIKSARKKVKAFADLLTALAARPVFPVRSFLDELLTRSGLERELKNDPDPEKAALANVNELLSSAAEYDAENPDGSVAGWLSQVSLSSDTDRLKQAGGAATLMTLHAAKGLEFPVVYIAGVEEGLLPHARVRTDEKGDLEEERRLMFVGMTRAMKRLTLTRAAYRMTRGFNERTIASQFLRELPDDEIETADFSGGEAAERSYDRDEPTQEIDERLLTRGRMVRHVDYGVGRITRVEIGRGRPWVKVRFPAYGEKSFSLQYAELEVVEL